jgi:hypothetical protein
MPPFFIKNVQLTKKEYEYLQYILSRGFKINENMAEKEQKKEEIILKKLKQVFNA